MSDGVPEGWSISTIGKCCDILDSKRIPLNSQERTNRRGIYPYYGANGVQGYIDDYIFDGESILLAEDGGYFDEWDSRPIAYLVSGKYWVNNHAHILRAKTPDLTKWVYYNIVHKNIQKHINGGTRAKLNQSDMRVIEVPLASVPEQQKIASILTSVDSVIEKTESQINKLQDLKKGMMQELLTKGIGHTEFKDSPIGSIPKEWEVGKLSDVSKKIWIGLVTTMTKHYVQNGIPLIRNSDIKENGIDTNRLIHLDNPFANDNKSRMVRTGDIVTVHTGDIGTSAVITKELDGAHGFATLNTRINPLIMNAHFYAFVLNSEFFKYQANTVVTGDGRNNLNMKDFVKLVIPIPNNIDEQQKIVTILQSVDTQIEKRKTKLKQTKSLKKSLMQDLLTGNVRVKLDDENEARLRQTFKRR